jgi:hypothetical protein
MKMEVSVLAFIKTLLKASPHILPLKQDLDYLPTTANLQYDVLLQARPGNCDNAKQGLQSVLLHAGPRMKSMVAAES